MAKGAQFLPQLKEVVNLAIEIDPKPTIRIRQGLMTQLRKIKDG